jgi:hypothetical protein
VGLPPVEFPVTVTPSVFPAPSVIDALVGVEEVELLAAVTSKHSSVDVSELEL